MKKLISFLLILFLPFLFSAQVNDKFPINELSPGLNSSHVKIVVFMPSLSEKTEYASMIVQAFKNYFVEKLAFAPENRDNVNIDIILVAQNKDKNEIKPNELLVEDLFDTQGMNVFYSINRKLKSLLNLPSLENDEDDSVLFLLDENNFIVWRDDRYRGQGEHLKPLEYKIKEWLHLPYPKIETANFPDLQTGNSAPDVLLEGMKLSDYKGSIVVLTFYPAAYSGVVDVKKWIKRIIDLKREMMMCAIQIHSFDSISLLTGRNVNYFAVTESTAEILNNWRDVMNAYHIRYINDFDYSVSQAFGAYNQEGYNNRLTVIIDPQGKIAYVDKNYTLSKEVDIQTIIQKIQADFPEEEE
ncbi:MAG: redoxin domain-containing protein [Flavobacteriaceae bacterium]|nr:redoxin domain-containing protein [Flavobacteriaceae bacterium]